MILVFLATLGIIVVGFVLYPVFGAERTDALGDSAEELALRDLEDKKARLYTAIKDLDFEKAAGKVSEEDYESARRDYLAQAAEVIAQIDQLAPAPAKNVSTTEEKSKKRASVSAETDTRPCPSCDEPNRESAKFCTACGQPLERACRQCGKELPERAKFCPECGLEVAS